MRELFFIILAMVGFLDSNAQSLRVRDIVDFYQNADIDCYKKMIYEDISQCDRWIQDTLRAQLPPGISTIWEPSDIDIRKYDAIHMVALRFHDVDSLQLEDNIYEHLELDSAVSVRLVPYDKQGKLLGITDDGSISGTYNSFINQNDWHSHDGSDKLLKKVLNFCKKKKADAIVYLSGICYGYIKNDSIYCFVEKKRRGHSHKAPKSFFVIELSRFVNQLMKKNNSILCFYTSDYNETYKSLFDWLYDDDPNFNKQKKRKRLCESAQGNQLELY